MVEWFEGNIDHALSEYQKKNGILIVYIREEKTDDANTLTFNSLWDLFDHSILERIPYIAIRLVKDSEGAIQFSQFFPTPVFPVCYVIGLGGAPLEVLTPAEELTLERLNNSLRKSIEHYETQLAEEGLKLQISKSGKPEVTVGTAEILKTSNAVSGKSSDGSESSATMNMTMEEKIEYARKRLEEKRKQDAEKKKAEEREKELQRRNEGKALLELRDKVKEKEMREMVEARQRQKREDEEAKKRVREQIQRDKEERERKAKGLPREETKPAIAPHDESKVNVPVNSDECKIQCKFPDGSTLVKVFPSSATLQSVFNTVEADERKPKPSFFLFQTYPRRQLTEPEKTLLDLGLTPASVLLVVPGAACP